MRVIGSILLVLVMCVSVFAQDGAMEGIDAFFMQPGYYDDLEMAKTDLDSVLYLDLSLQSPKLKEIPAVVFSFKNLKYLELAYNQIGVVGDEIAALEQLEVLGLNGNKYLTSVSDKLVALSSLKELHLNDTGLSAEQLNQTEKKLPSGCRLVR